MSEVSIFGKRWIDIVFEGKNKSYGAYQLRQENPRTTLAAFFIGILFLGSLCGGGFLLSSFSEKPAVPVTPELPPVTFVEFADVIPELPEPKKDVAPPVANTDEPTENLNNPEVVTANNDPVDVKPNTDNTPANPDTGNATAAGSGDAPTTAGTGSTNGQVAAVNPNSIHRTGALDVQPKFPGGIDGFRTFIAKNFDQPELDGEGKLTVLVSFVIERDGSISTIKVLENPGHGLDKEAIRVLKSLKTKWEPGKKNGENVRTVFVMPISVVAN